MNVTVDLHDVEYGECIVLHGGGEALMVDCGSNNRLIRDGNVPFFDYVRRGIMPLYRELRARSFLLTHCHRDHLCGLWRILREDPGYFDRLFLPVSPAGQNGRLALLEFALYVHTFVGRMTDYCHLNTGVLRLYRRTVRCAGAERVFPLRAGDLFPFAGEDYEVLWPPESGFPFSKELNGRIAQWDSLLSSGPLSPPAAREFLRLKMEFSAAYDACCRQSPVNPQTVSEADGILCRVEALVPELRRLPSAGRITADASSQEAQQAYSDALNAASILFQNQRKLGRGAGSYRRDILMTGDAPPEIIRAVESGLYDGYYILKAPHHGTQSCFSPAFREISAEHILISSGVSGGPVSAEYARLPGIRHCTGQSTCPRFARERACCNRLSLCHESARPGMLPHPGFPVSCAANTRPRDGEVPPCGIRVLAPSGSRACLCDIPRNNRL